jgi:hypothetical protein
MHQSLSENYIFSWNVSNEDKIYIKVIAMDEIYEFLVLKCFIWDR